MPVELSEIKSQLDQAHTEMASTLQKQSDEIKQYGQSTEKTANELKSVEKRLEEVNSDFGERLEQVEKRMGRPGDNGAPGAEQKSAGQLFAESEAYKSAVQRGDTKTDAVELKDITSAAGSAGAIALSQRVREVFRDPADRLQHIRQLMNVAQTSSGSIEYFVDHSGFTNNAGAQDGELALKNKSDLQLEEKTAAVKTIAHHVIASRQVMDDAPMLASYIDGRLANGLMLEEDEQLLYGDGTGGTLTGIFNTDGVQDHGDRPAADDFVTHLRRAMTKARKSNYAPNGIAINPTDWESIELLKNDDGDFIWVWYMGANDQPRVFRVPVIETNAVNEGDFLLGNWDMAATLWDRQQANIRVSDSHAELFTKNGVAIRGEERLALTVERPQAFVKGSFNEAAPE